MYYADKNAQYVRDLFSVPVAGGTPVQLNTTTFDGSIRKYELSPDGTRVVYLAKKGSNIQQLYSVPIAGGTPELLNSPITSGGVFRFDVSQNGDKVAYSLSNEAFIVPVAGGEAPVALNTNPVNGSFIDDIFISSEGDNVGFILSSDPATQEVLFSSSMGGANSLGTFISTLPSYINIDPVSSLQFLDNSTLLFSVQNANTTNKLVVSTLSSALSAATLDSPTQITATFSETVATNGGNPGDFMVTDGIGNTFPVSVQADGTAGDADIVLTVADVSTAVGDLTVTYTNNNDEITNLTTSDPVGTDDIGVVIDTDMSVPTLVSAVKDSDTQITLTMSELVQTNGTNPTDFSVTDGLGTAFAVSTQADGTAEDTEIVLTVADLSTAVGDLTVTYTNNNNEISDFGSNDLATDATGVVIDTDNTAPTLVSAVKDTDTQITITLSEPVQTNGTNPTDFTVTDGIGTDFAVSTQADGTVKDTDIILTVTDLSTAVGDLTVTYTDNNNEVGDFGGNVLATDATGVSIDIDMTAPTLVSAVKDTDTQITITLSEPVQTNGGNPTDFTVTDGLGSTYTLSAQADGTALDTDIVLTVADLSIAVGDLTVTYTNNNNEITDFGGNTMASDATGIVILLDVIPPDVTLTTMANDPNSGAFDITATFTEDVMNVATGDFNVTNGSATTVSGTGAVYTVTITPIADGTVTVNLPANTVQDLANNDNTASNTVSLENDETAPTVTISSAANDPTSGAFDITITFSEDVTGFDMSDITVGNGVAGNFASSASTYTATITPSADGTVTVDIASGAAEDAATNSNTAATQFSIENDESDPTVTISTAANDPTSGAFDITITFSEAVTGFDFADITVGNGVAGNFAGSGDTYTATITPAADGTVTIDVAGAVAQDAAGNDNTAATQFSIENDETAPTVTISTAANDPVSGAFDITISFSEAVTGFDMTDLTVGNGTAGSFTGTGDTYTVTITPAVDGTVTVDVAGAVAQDAAGNDNTVALQFSIENDETAPTVTISAAANDPTSGAFDITITFSEDVTGFDISDITVGNGVAGNFAGSADTYTATITPSADGTVTVDIAANGAQDAATNGNTAATQFSIENDETDPTVTISTAANDPTSGAFDITITFSEAVTGFDMSDLTVGNGAAGNFAGSGDTYTATITPSADGTVTVDVAGAVAQDAAGNDNVAATQFSIENDETDPTVTISTAANDPTSGAFDITITFSEDVTGFDMSDLTVSNGTAGSFAGSGDTYTVIITPAADGTVTIDVLANVAQDAAGNDNMASAQFSIEADLTAPSAPVITGISNDTGSDTNDGITSDNTLIFSGTAEANSTVEVFIDGNSISTTVTDGAGNWTFDHSTTSLADGNYSVTATAMDAATNTSALSAMFAVIIDQTAPNNPLLGSISDDNGISSTDFITNDGTLIYYGTAEPFATITIGSGPFTLLTTTADANGDWVGDATFRPFASPLNLFITATDGAGNASANTNTFLIDIDTVVPIVQSIVRADPNPTTASSVGFTVTFSEEVYGLSPSNFSLALTSTQNANIASLSASSGMSITVTVDNITGSGTFGLNLSDIAGVTDVAGNNLAGTFTGEIYNTNFFPTDLTLSASSILENNTIGDVVAMLSTTDADAGDTHTYSLVTGAGDTDNASFTIAGDELKAAEAFDLETKASYDIRIQTDDGRGGTFEEAFTITIDNVPEADMRITGNNDIPATPLGITTNFDITIHNDGDATLNISSILYPTAFGGPVSGITVAPAGSQVVTLSFTPAVAQLYTGDITVISNGGTGILSVSADGAIITSVDNGLLKAEAIKLYPNPATDVVTIDLSKYNGRALDIELYDMAGIKTFGISQYGESTLKLDVSRYHNGLYLVQFTDGKSTVQKKVMIRK
ncbi:MAG: hypothetical protein Roseis3KO_30340 [Roseivirga sp.]